MPRDPVAQPRVRDAARRAPDGARRPGPTPRGAPWGWVLRRPDRAGRSRP